MSFSTITDRDQLRSLKNAVQSRLSSTFRYRRESRFSCETVIAPSAPQSECSTLVDYVPSCNFKDTSEYILEDEQDDWLLEEENCAWTRGKPRAPKPTQRRHRQSSRGVTHPLQSEMINAEDRAWAMPGKPPKNSSKLPCFPSFSVAGRRTKAPNPSGIEPQLLDPEDRAWV